MVKLLIQVEGGVVTHIASSEPIEYMIIDHDTDESLEEQTEVVFREDMILEKQEDLVNLLAEMEIEKDNSDYLID